MQIWYFALTATVVAMTTTLADWIYPKSLYRVPRTIRFVVCYVAVPLVAIAIALQLIRSDWLDSDQETLTLAAFAIPLFAARITAAMLGAYTRTSRIVRIGLGLAVAGLSFLGFVALAFPLTFERNYVPRHFDSPPITFANRPTIWFQAQMLQAVDQQTSTIVRIVVLRYPDFCCAGPRGYRLPDGYVAPTLVSEAQMAIRGSSSSTSDQDLNVAWLWIVAPKNPGSAVAGLRIVYSKTLKTSADPPRSVAILPPPNSRIGMPPNSDLLIFSNVSRISVRPLQLTWAGMGTIVAVLGTLTGIFTTLAGYFRRPNAALEKRPIVLP